MVTRYRDSSVKIASQGQADLLDFSGIAILPTATGDDFSATAARSVDLRKLKFTEIRKPFPDILPDQVQIIISNVGNQDISEITIGYTAQRMGRCSSDMGGYDGVKKFYVTLAAGDLVTLRETFSVNAQQFCIVSARTAE